MFTMRRFLIIAVLALAGCSAAAQSSNTTAASPSPDASPTPKPDPANSLRGDYDQEPPIYRGTVDGCRIFEFHDYHTIYVAHCSDSHARVSYGGSSAKGSSYLIQMI